jgi:hypothetical protein
VGGDTGVGAGAGGDAVTEEVRTEERRPHCGQTARLPDPVAWSATWHLGQRVLRPEAVNTGAGAAGGRSAPERVVSGAAAGATIDGAAGATRAHRTVRRPGS